ncbi:MAG: GH25 family lysozyme [bacterium]
MMKRTLFIVALLSLTAGMMHFGIWPINDPPLPVKGVDVSHYQGEIDWPTLASQNVSFAYIKATEGSGSADERFTENLRGATEAGLPVGAYHFFSYDSPGASQAEHFIKTVPDLPLPPVIDVEFYGDYTRNPADPQTVRRELWAMADRLEAHYCRVPMLYATGRSYLLYIRGTALENLHIWIRDVYGVPGGDWALWQYSDRGRLKGYDGDTPYIDLDVFNGDRASFEAWAGISQ